MAYNPNAEKVEQSAWNLSQHEIMQIGYLSSRATSLFLSGNLQDCFWNTQQIRHLIHTDLKEQQDKILNDIEKKINKIYNSMQIGLKIIANLQDEYEDEDLEQIKFLKLKLSKLKQAHLEQVTKYRLRIREYLGLYGYLISKKQDAEDTVDF